MPKPRVMGQEDFPAHVMSPERLEFSKSFGLASRLPFTLPEPVEPEPAPRSPHFTTAAELNAQSAAVVHATTDARKQLLSLVGQTISGREHLVLQVPGGQVRYEGTPEGATECARRLAGEESASFVVMQPNRICAPQTVIHEEVL